jgi:four helix bundle protein
VRYLYIAQASNAEARTRLQLANDRQSLRDDQLKQCDEIADEVARMLTGLIKYLSRCDLKDRRQGIRQSAGQPTKNEG